MNVIFQLMVLLALMVGAHNRTSAAEGADDYYQAVLLVEKRTAPTSGVVQEGLRQVLRKVSGQYEVEQVVDEQSDYSRYVSGFHFEPTLLVRTNHDGDDYLAQKLIINFNQALVNELLLDHQRFPIGAYRPEFVFKIPIHSALSLGLSTSYEPFGDVIKDFSEQLAIPVRLLNQHDSDFSRFYVELLAEELGVSRWRRVAGEERREVSFEGDRTQQLDQLFSWLLSDFGVTRIPGDEGVEKTFVIRVTHVENLADYAALLELLGAFPSLQTYRVIMFHAGELELEVNTSLSKDALIRVLGLERRMRLIRKLDPTQDQSTLEWRWFGKRRR
jgi:hypothetical protein